MPDKLLLGSWVPLQETGTDAGMKGKEVPLSHRSFVVDFL